MKMEDSESVPASAEPSVWSFRGYSLRPSDFVTSMVHFYRGEIARSNTWRTRLDNTTNWSVITTAAVLTFAFGATENSHVVILISMFLIWLFLVIESRRYRYYELWALRVRLMETEFFATMLYPPFSPHREWASRLVDSLLTPEFPISFWEALGRRLRRNYIWLFLVLGLAWTLKLILHPTVSESVGAFVQHAAIGFVPGSITLIAVGFFYFAVFAVAILTAGLRASPGEVLSRGEVLGISREFLEKLSKAAGEIPFMTRHEQLVIIITDKPKDVGRRLMELLKRGVTALEGTGMYSGEARSVLFCAIAPAEISRLKSVVRAADEHAFIVVNPTEEVLGGGFGDLSAETRRWWKRGRRKAGTGDLSR